MQQSDGPWFDSGRPDFRKVFMECAHVIPKSSLRFFLLSSLSWLGLRWRSLGLNPACVCLDCFFRTSQPKTWSRKMSSPGVEPGLSRPQRDVLTTRRWGLNTDKQKQAFDQCKNLNFQGGRNEIIAFNMITTGLLQWCSLCGLESHSRRICNPAFITEAFFSTLLSHRL